MMNEPMLEQGKLEIIVETFEDMTAAVQGGATQLDLKSHYPCSGVSPSAGIVARAVSEINVPAMIMVRPHARSFVMNQEDINTACEEVKQNRKLGARNFLVGFLTPQNDLDVNGLKKIKDAAGDCELHAHLAWELTNDPVKSIEQLIEIGFKSLRTSGRTASQGAFGGSAASALTAILDFKKVVAGRIELFLAGGVNERNINEIIQKTEIMNLHSGRAARTPESAESPVDRSKVERLRLRQIEAIKNLHQ